ncbi:hypothetical protein EMIT0196MI5_330028 [Pseudomonas sp. IT-196MI5]
MGASLLAMDVNDNAFCLNKRVALEFIASKLAPTNHRLLNRRPIIAVRRPPETVLFQLP